MSEVAAEVARLSGVGTERATVPSAARRPPSGSPSSASSTRSPTSVSARCTSPSSRWSTRRRRRPALLPTPCSADGATPAGPRGPAHHRARRRGGARAARARARHHRRARLRHLLPHRRRRGRPDPLDAGARRRTWFGSRVAGHVPARHLRGRPAPARPASSSAFSHRFVRRCPTSTSTSSRLAAPRSTPASSSVSATTASPASRWPTPTASGTRSVTSVPRSGLPPSEIDTVAKAFPHIRARDAQNALRELPELRASRIADDPRLALLLRARRTARRPAAPSRSAPVRRPAVRRHAARPHPGRVERDGFCHEPVRQGRRRAPRSAQARRARHPHAVGDGVRARRDRVGSTATTRARTSTPSRSTTPPPTTSSGRRTPSAASRSSHRVSVSWSASSPPRRSTTSSSTSRSSVPAR